MRVLLVTNWFPTAESRAGGFNRRDAAMLALDNEITVLHLHAPGTVSPDEPHVLTIEQGIRVFRVPFSLAKPWTIRPALSALKRLQEHADVLHTSAFPVFAAMLLARARLPWVHTEHASKVWSKDLNWRGRLSRSVLLRQFRRPDVVVAVSSALADEIARYRVKKPTRVVGNQVQLADPSNGATVPLTDSSALHLVGVGMLIPTKGVIEAVETVHRLVESGKDAHLEWVGYGPQEKEVRRRADELGIAGRVRLLGLIPHEAVPEVLCRSNLFIAPTVSETFGTAIAEALGQGLPVVATGRGGHTGYLPPHSSRIVTERSADAIADAILDLANDQNRWQAPQIIAYARRMFSDDYRRGRYHEIYQEAQRIFQARKHV